MATQAQHLSHAPAKGRAVVFGSLLTLAILSAALLANSMTKPVSRDEHMYCTAGVLLARGQSIYEDFAYPSQLPYHPLVLATLYKLLATSHYLLVGRLVSVVCDILVLVSIVGIYRSVFTVDRHAGLLLGTVAAALYTFNPLVDYAAGYAWNHDVVVLCVMLSFWLLITTDFQQKTRYGRLALMGALLTFATCMRITTALVEAFFLLAICIAARGSVRNRLYAALPFSLAGLVVLAWPVWVAAGAGEAFRLNLVRIPALYGRWLHEIGIVHSKASLTVVALTTPGYLALLAVAGYLVWTLLRRRSRLKAEARTMAIIAALLPLVLFIIAYIPPTMWRQYLAIPVPFIVIALAYPLAELRHDADTVPGLKPFRLACAAMGIALIFAVLANPTVLLRSLAVLAPEHWVPIKLHKISTDIANQTAEPKRALTLGPLYALEGGCDIYPELACGAIVYRVADSMSAAEREMTSTVGPASLNSLIAQEPPEAVILGVEPTYFAFLEEPLRGVVSPNWRRGIYEGVLQVYIRP